MVISYFGGKQKMSDWIYSHITAEMKEHFGSFIKTEMNWVFEHKITQLGEDKIKELA